MYQRVIATIMLPTGSGCLKLREFCGRASPANRGVHTQAELSPMASTYSINTMQDDIQYRLLMHTEGPHFMLMNESNNHRFREWSTTRLPVTAISSKSLLRMAYAHAQTLTLKHSPLRVTSPKTKTWSYD